MFKCSILKYSRDKFKQLQVSPCCLVQFKCAKTDYWNICQLNCGLVQFDVEYSDIQQIFNKYLTNIQQIFEKYSRNIWQIFNKYLTNIETVRGFPLWPGRVRCTQRELWSCQHQNPGLEKNNQSINFRINGSDHQRIELQKSIYKRTSLLSAKSMSGKIEQVGWKRLGSAYLRHFLFKLLFLPGGCVSGSPRWKQSVDLAKALWRSAVFNVKQQSFSFVLNLGRVQTI